MFEQIMLLFFDAEMSAIITSWAGAIATVILSMKGITIITPSKTDNKAYNVVMKIINTLGLNVGKAKNADDA